MISSAVSISILSGCAATKPTTIGDTTKSNNTGTTTTQNLRFIDVSPSPKRQEYFTSTFEKFKQSAGISAAYESVPWDEAANKLTVLGASKQLPDVMTTWAGWVSIQLQDGYFLLINTLKELRISIQMLLQISFGSLNVSFTVEPIQFLME